MLHGNCRRSSSLYARPRTPRGMRIIVLIILQMFRIHFVEWDSEVLVAVPKMPVGVNIRYGKLSWIQWDVVSMSMSPSKAELVQPKQFTIRQTSRIELIPTQLNCFANFPFYFQAGDPRNAQIIKPGIFYPLKDQRRLTRHQRSQALI